MSEKRNTKVVTGLVRFSFIKVFNPEIDELTGEKKYSIQLLIPKTDKKTVSTIKKAIEEAKESGREKFWGKSLPKNLYIRSGKGTIILTLPARLPLASSERISYQCRTKKSYILAVMVMHQSTSILTIKREMQALLVA